MDKSQDKERLFSGYTGRLFVTFSVGWMALLFGRELLPPLLLVFIDRLSISPSAAGFALTLLWTLTAVSQYPGSCSRL